MSEHAIWKASSYAKINVGLHVLNRLPNGYHEIETGFAFIEWFDEITMQEAKSMEVSINDYRLMNDNNTLIHKAIQVLKDAGFTVPNLKIDVNKRIPLGAGLGGGSSNAALTLRMINKIAKLEIEEKKLLELGASLGADVPVFIKGEPCFATGIGTTLKKAAIQPDAWIVTVYPNESSSTKEAYENCEPNSDREYHLLDELQTGELEEWRYFLENDLEKTVIPYHPIIGDFKDQMYDFGAMYAAMSGSGSSVFGLFEQDFVALSAYDAFIRLGYPASVTRPGFKPDLGIYRID
ncbi:4-(cytidine 5'-diphospho)-2-C-methyl-D-erythritol kinase [bacterium]|nr:MAG: 4-(cytidine 5'-diphospho)-2-C-methyl-D-erythritol kinase [bacterium]